MIPAYASTPEGLALLDAIKAERPAPRWYLRRNAWVSARYPRYKGMNARALRRLWEAAREAAMDANDPDAFARLTNHEHPDDVIARLLAEPDEQLTETRGDPLLPKRRAAA